MASGSTPTSPTPPWCGDSDCSECRSVPPWWVPRSPSNPRSAEARRCSYGWDQVSLAAGRTRPWVRGTGSIMSEEAGALRILLADDHLTVRYGLKLMIDQQPDMKVVAEASDGRAALELARASDVDVVVLDISMPGMNGLEATRKLKQLRPGIAIVTLTRHADDAYLQELLRAGVSGYVLKQSAPAELVQAIRAAAAGGQYLDSALTARVTAAFMGRQPRHKTQPSAAVSERESEVLRLIASGYSNKEIASRLSLSVKTVEAHKANAMRKLDLR